MSSCDDLYAVNAGYRRSDIGASWYYVFANDAEEAQSKFLSRLMWLDVYGVRKCREGERAMILKNYKWHVVIV